MIIGKSKKVGLGVLEEGLRRAVGDGLLCENMLPEGTTMFRLLERERMDLRYFKDVRGRDWSSISRLDKAKPKELKELREHLTERDETRFELTLYIRHRPSCMWLREIELCYGRYMKGGECRYALGFMPGVEICEREEWDEVFPACGDLLNEFAEAAGFGGQLKWTWAKDVAEAKEREWDTYPIRYYFETDFEIFDRQALAKIPQNQVSLTAPPYETFGDHLVTGSYGFEITNLTKEQFEAGREGMEALVKEKKWGSVKSGHAIAFWEDFTDEGGWPEVVETLGGERWWLLSGNAPEKCFGADEIGDLPEVDGLLVPLGYFKRPHNLIWLDAYRDGDEWQVWMTLGDGASPKKAAAAKLRERVAGWFGEDDFFPGDQKWPHMYG